MNCAKCKGEAEGYKCAICGEEAEKSEGHEHEGSDRYMTAKCKNCGEADVHCSC
ncbi:MAG TPA: hypothetical protein VF185_03155 [Patescibacteria group bacterium]